MSPLMQYVLTFFLGSIIVSRFLFGDDTNNTTIGTFTKIIIFAGLVFILQTDSENIWDSSDIVSAFTAIFTTIFIMYCKKIYLYNKAIEFQTMTARSLAAIDESGNTLFQDGPER
ncbi:hypothetical protein ACHAPG_010342 [Botrytis cinerea]